MKDITIIIPLHEYNDYVKALLTRAIQSVPNDYLVHIINPTKLENDLKWLVDEFNNVTILTAID